MRRVNENDALAALHLLKLLAAVEARHDFEGIYQTAYQREVIEFICLLMRRGGCKLYTSPATLPPVKTLCSLLQSNPAFVHDHNQNPSVTSSDTFCAFFFFFFVVHKPILRELCFFLFFVFFFLFFESGGGLLEFIAASPSFLTEFNLCHLRTFYEQIQLS